MEQAFRNSLLLVTIFTHTHKCYENTFDSHSRVRLLQEYSEYISIYIYINHQVGSIQQQGEVVFVFFGHLRRVDDYGAPVLVWRDRGGRF